MSCANRHCSDRCSSMKEENKLKILFQKVYNETITLPSSINIVLGSYKVQHVQQWLLVRVIVVLSVAGFLGFLNCLIKKKDSPIL